MATSSILKMTTELYDATGKKSIELFYIQKAASMANIAMSTAEGAMKAYAQLGPIFGTIAAALIIGVGAAEEINVASQQPPKMAEGGHLRGRKHSSGGIPIEAEDNEFIIKSRAVDYYGADRIAAINSMAISRSLMSSVVPSYHVSYPSGKFASGGAVSPAAGTGVNVTIANFTDPALFEKFMKTTEGQNAFVNTLNETAYKSLKALGLS
jgi:hypothetical protein